jgi:[protein-PII] uridylyltransferase
LGAAVPELALNLNLTPVPDDLICAPDDIIDRRALRRAVSDAIAQSGSTGAERRKAVVPLFKDAMEQGRKKIAADGCDCD